MIERSDVPVENSIDRPHYEQLVPKSVGYEDVEKYLHNTHFERHFILNTMFLQTLSMSFFVKSSSIIV
jgi:hypothetical protein